MRTIRIAFTLSLVASLFGAVELARADDCEGISCKCMDCDPGEDTGSASSSGVPHPMKPPPTLAGAASTIITFPLTLGVGALATPVALIQCPFDGCRSMSTIWEAWVDTCPPVAIHRWLTHAEPNS